MKESIVAWSEDDGKINGPFCSWRLCGYRVLVVGRGDTGSGSR